MSAGRFRTCCDREATNFRQLPAMKVRISRTAPDESPAIDDARERGIPVLFKPMACTEEDYANEALHHRPGINRSGREIGRMARTT